MRVLHYKKEGRSGASEQEMALNKHCAKTVWFDGEDLGFVKAVSIKITLQMKLSPYKKILGNGRKVVLGKKLVGFASLLFVVLQGVSTYCQRRDRDVGSIRPFVGYLLGITS